MIPEAGFAFEQSAPPRPDLQPPVVEKLMTFMQDSRVTGNLFLTAQAVLGDVVMPGCSPERLKDAEMLLVLADVALSTAIVIQPETLTPPPSKPRRNIFMMIKQMQAKRRSIKAANKARAAAPDPEQAVIDAMHEAFRRNLE